LFRRETGFLTQHRRQNLLHGHNVTACSDRMRGKGVAVAIPFIVLQANDVIVVSASECSFELTKTNPLWFTRVTVSFLDLADHARVHRGIPPVWSNNHKWLARGSDDYRRQKQKSTVMRLHQVLFRRNRVGLQAIQRLNSPSPLIAQPTYLNRRTILDGRVYQRIVIAASSTTP
jgi:hypothetical protein